MDREILLHGEKVMSTRYCLSDDVGSYNADDHSLIFVAAGHLEIEEPGQSPSIVREGECVFVRKDMRLRLRRYVGEEKGFHLSISLHFPRRFLFDFYRGLKPSQLPEEVQRSERSQLKIAGTVAVDSLFESFRPYYYAGEDPDEMWLASRLGEGLRIVLGADANTYASLFNFASRWRRDLLEFMEENYMYDLTLSEFAQYSGRSLATFKRDFSSVSDLTPQQWLIARRLRSARKMIIETDEPIRTILNEVGFKNFSHFSKLYHKRYGQTPTADRRWQRYLLTREKK